MASLPTVGGDDNAWGAILNAYLLVAHNADGTLKAGWSTGSTNPTTLTGDGSFYINTSNGEVWKQVSGAWVDQGFSLQGPTGSAGPSGGGASPPQFYTLASGTSIGDSTITLDRTPDAAVTSGRGVLVIGAYTTHAETRVYSSNSTATVTLRNPKTFTSSAVTFTAATNRIAATAIGTNFVTGMKIKITGSGSNNGVFTVTDWEKNGSTNNYLTVAETVVDEAAGASVTIKRDLEVAHSSGETVMWWPGHLIPSDMLGIKSTGSTSDAGTNGTQMQRAANDYWHHLNYYGGLQMTGGRCYIGQMIHWPTFIMVKGSGVDTTIITASGITFSSSADAMFLLHNDGKESSRLSRIHLQDLELSGNNISGANGIYAALQQPTQWINFRVVNCPSGYGIKIIGQQTVMTNIEVTACDIGLYMDNCEFFWIRGLNIEQCTTNMIYCNSGFWNHIQDVHLESGPSNGIWIDHEGTLIDGWVWEHVWASNVNDNSTLFKFGGSGGLSPACTFELSHVRANQNSSTFKIIDDTVRGISRTSAQVNRIIHRIMSGQYNTDHIVTTGAWAMEMTGAGSGSDGLGVGQGWDLPPIFGNGIAFQRSTNLRGSLFGGEGLPSNNVGSVGDFYLRYDTPSTSNQRLYVKTATSTWTGIL